jgi:uncharacterized protein YndB with AHSA1/START domain
MKRFRSSMEIGAAPEAVWRVLADIASWPTWDPTTDSAEGVIEKDAKLKFVSTLAPGRPLDVKVSAIDEPFLLEWTGGMPPQLVSLRTHSITPKGDKCSLVQVSQEMSGPMWSQIDASFPDLDKAFADFLLGLKKRVETGSSWKAAAPAMAAQAMEDQNWGVDFNRRMREDPDRVLHMVRRFEASPERVYDAWTDPKFVALWLFTGPTSEAHTCEMDPRAGGRWTINDTRDGVKYTATGEFIVADRPRKVSFTFAMPQFSHEHDLVTVTFEPDGDGCIMRFKQEGIAQMAKGPSESGWTPMFEGLAKAIGTPPPKVL